MKKLIAIAILCLTGVLHAGCTKQYNVDVNGITAQPPITLKTDCIILPANSGVTPHDLLFKEFSIYVADALSKKGYDVTNNPQASTGILMGYGIGDPLEKVSHNAYPAVSFGGFYNGWHDGWGWGGGPSFYFPIGNYDSYTTYGAHLFLAAYDMHEFKTTGNMVYSWQLIVNLRSTSDDLRQLMPIMTAAALPYIGLNTVHQLEETVAADNPYVSELEALKPNATKPSQRTDYSTPQ